MGKNYSYDVCIIGGCGHAGLPLGVAFADRGLQVVLYDIDQTKVHSINEKIMPFHEEGAPPLLAKAVDSKKLVATSHITAISQARNVILVIGTPVDEHLNPKLHHVMSAVHQIIEYLQDEQLIVLRSTLYPGTTQKIHGVIRSRGRMTDIAFCPERIAEGHALQELMTLPQIVSGVDRKSVARATELFSILTNDIVELSPLEAELAKLFTNAWRYINFAISNQFYMIASNYGLDFYRIYHAMTKNYPRVEGMARAGFTAGPCLFKDTMQLSACSHNTFLMGHAAMLVNEGLPNYVVERLKLTIPLQEKTVGILGMAFKANHDDPRDSLSYKLKKILDMEAREVVCSDAYITQADFVTAEQLVDRADLIILGAPHREYKSLDFHGKPVVDVWSFLVKGDKAI